MNYKALCPICVLAALAGCTLDEPVNYDIMCGGKLGIAGINDNGTLFKPDEKCTASKSKCKSYEKAFESSICPKDFTCVAEERLCINTECEEGSHYTLEGCKADSVNACGSSTNDCTKITGWAEGACVNGECYASACQTGYELAAEQCHARTSCPANFHLFAGNCEEDSINQCGTHTTDCEKLPGWVDGSCQESRCIASKCQDAYKINPITNQCEASSCPDDKYLYDGKCLPNDTENCGSYKRACNASTVAGWLEGECKDGQCFATKCSIGYNPTDTGVCKADKDCGEDMHYSATAEDECVPDTPENCGWDGNNCLEKPSWAEAICYGGHCVATACANDATLENHDCAVNPACKPSCNLNTLNTCENGKVVSVECQVGEQCTTQDGKTGCYPATPCGNSPHGTTKCNSNCDGVIICNNGEWVAQKSCEEGTTCSLSVCAKHEFNYTSIKEIKDDYDAIVECPMAERTYNVTGVVTFGSPSEGFYMQNDNSVEEADQRGVYIKHQNTGVDYYSVVTVEGTQIAVSNGQLQLTGNDLNISVGKTKKSEDDIDIPELTEEAFIKGGTNSPYTDRLITLQNTAIKRGSIDLSNYFQVTTEGNIEGFTLEACIAAYYSLFNKATSLQKLQYGGYLINAIYGTGYYGCLGTGTNYTNKLMDKYNDTNDLSTFNSTDAVMALRAVFVKQIRTFTFDITGVGFYNKDYSIYVPHTDNLKPSGCLDQTLTFTYDYENPTCE